MILTKMSSPGWEKKFYSEYDLVEELRSHICNSCLRGGSTYVYEDNSGEICEDIEPFVDVIHDGVLYECRDLPTLLSTPCGCEFFVEQEDEN